MKAQLLILFLFSICGTLPAQNLLDELLPVRGLCIKAPTTENVDRMVKFMDEELSRLNVNLLILRIDYNYQYQSRSEFKNEDGLSHADIKKMVAMGKKHNIRLIPQINLFGHQSWSTTLGPLLTIYPEFDETPDVKIPDTYAWPNEDGLYCKSYCPLHPDVHEVVFDLVDEIVEVFETDAFHAGLDEVFYIGEDQCPRCRGRDKAELFAGEVTKIRNHLAQSTTELWMWGDRLLDGASTGLGMWEASMNQTYRAIDMIPKDVVICDWHYETPVPTDAYFATKGFRVATCPWRKAEVAKSQLSQTLRLRENATPVMKDRFIGMIQTTWIGFESFMDIYDGLEANQDPRGDQVGCFKSLFDEISKIERSPSKGSN